MRTLQLNLTERKIQVKGNQLPRKYLDFLINDQSLISLLGNENSDLISPFGWAENKAYEKEMLQQYRLQKKSDLESGKTMLYVCPECGDIGCGAVTFVIKDLGDRIQWSNFGYENGYSDTELYNFPPLEFERQQYFNALKAIQKAIE